MIINSEHGDFYLLKNYKDAFNLEKFNERYVDVIFKQYDYIVGDISSDMLRLKGFRDSPKGSQSYNLIPDYLNESCNYNVAYFILKRVKKV